MNFPRIGHATVALPSGEVLVLGGHALALPLEEPWGSERIALVEEIEVFDGVSSFRRLEHDLPFPRSDSSAFRTVSGEIVVVGGVAKTVGYSLENDGLWPGQDCGWPDCSVEANRPVVWLSEAGITLAVTFREANFTLRTPPMVELDPGILVLGGSGTTTEVTTELLTEDDWISHPVISSLNKPRYVGAGVKLGVRFDDYRALVVSRGLIATLEMPSGRLTDIADLTGTYSEGGWSVHWEGLVPVSPERFLLVGHSQRDGFMSKFVETSSVGTATITDAPSPLSRRDDAILTALGDGRAVRWGGWPWQSGIPAHRDIDRSRVLEIYDPRAHGFYLASETPNNR
ncbi:MAG: hypothetical protein HY791_11600 [Deltaproteobacteria bacterium]|nr:hypothetical protein [Deltaproteobacteria bacterium]